MEDKLYHYCKLSTAIEKILKNKELRLSTYDKTNDPRENKAFVFAVCEFENKIENLEIYGKDFTKELRQGVKLLCFSQDSNNEENDLHGYELSKMWAHYGDNHNGICLEIDKAKFIEENCLDEKYCKPIIYKSVTLSNFNNFIKVNDKALKEEKEKYINEFKNDYLDYLFFTKTKEWEHENEFRVLLFSDDIKDEFYRIQNSLTGIYMGVQHKEDEQLYLSTIKNLVNDIPIYELKYINGKMLKNRQLNQAVK